MLLWLPVGLALAAGAASHSVQRVGRLGLGWLGLIIFAFYPFSSSGVNALIRNALARRRVSLQVFVDSLGTYAISIAGGFLALTLLQSVLDMARTPRSWTSGATYALLALSHLWFAVTVVSEVPFPESLRYAAKVLQRRMGDFTPLLLLALLWVALGAQTGRHMTLMLRQLALGGAGWRYLLGTAVVTAGTIVLRIAIFAAYTGED